MSKEKAFIEITPRDIYNLIKENTEHTISNGKKIDKINGNVGFNSKWLGYLSTGVGLLAAACGSAFLFIMARI